MARPVAECEQSRLEQVEQFGRRLQTEQESMAVTFAEQIAGIEQSMAEKLRAHETFVQRELERRMDEAEVGRTALKWMSTVSELRSSLGAQKEALSQADSAQREARSQAEEGLAEMKRSLGLQRELQQQAQHELARAMHLRADIERWWSSQSEAASASGAASAKADKRPAAPAAPVPGPGAPAGPSEEVQKRLEVQSLKLKLLQAQVDTLMQATPVPAATALGSASDLLAQFQDCTNEDERRQLFEALLSQSSAALQPAAPMRPGGCSGQLSPGLSAQLSPLRSRPSSTGQLSSERLSPELSAQPSPVRSRPSSTGQLSSERLSPGHPRGREEPAQAAGPGAPGPSPLPEWAPLPSAARASAGASPPQGQRSGGSLGAGALRAPAPRAVEHSGLAAVCSSPAPPPAPAPRAVENSGLAAVCSSTNPPPPQSQDPAARGLAGQQGFSTVLASPLAGYFTLEPPMPQQHAGAWAGQPTAVPWQASSALSGAHARAPGAQGHVVPYILSGAQRGPRLLESSERTLGASRPALGL
ncbi:unnamed protein product [Prorocentrum cordatum]|uniref:Centrosomal protein POC5 n=1 Tax=Prorocentrum cordatum TaxID=2364126 RepID=A0ABN9VB33_9DINO|nr:unnamed protein product [Polarella glacialis]